MFARRVFAVVPRACNARMYSSSGSSKPSSGPTSRGGSLAVQSSQQTKRKTGFSGGVEGEGETWDNDGLGAKLPAVPNTEHLHPSEVAASSFFALHRPLSIKHSVPQVHSTTAFNSIFDPISLTQDANSNSTILPLPATPSTTTSSPGTPSPSTFTTYHPQQRHSKPVERTIMGDLESLANSIRDNWATGSFKASSLASSISRANSTARQEGEYSPEDDFSARLFPTTVNTHLPFHPPPPPVPRAAESNTENMRPHRQLITIHQTIYPNGMYMFTARSKVIAPITSPYMQRVRERQRENMELWQERVMEEAKKSGAVGEQVSDLEQGDRDMMAISVKRQRRLRMKKHKHKKLMDKTRNLRRKLEKQ